jgi:hypothetical protein
MKEDPENLNENLKRMVDKLEAVKASKVKELLEKSADLERIQKMGKRDSLGKIRSDVEKLKFSGDQDL